MTPSHLKRAILGTVILCCLALYGQVGAHAQAESHLSSITVDRQADLTAFEQDLETLRQSLGIPGMSAAVVRDQELVWAKGFGYADLERQVAATPNTPYGLASVTKPVAAVLVMQLVEEGWIDLDAPIAEYGVVFENAQSITVRHLLTHSSEGVPGTTFHYHGNRYALLGGVIEGATGKTFAEQLGERVLLPLGMADTALNPISNWGPGDRSGLGDFKRSLGLGRFYEHYPGVYRRLARPYQFGETYQPVPGKYHLYHGPAAGLLSSAGDLARFDIALDQGTLLAEETKAQMWAPAYSTYPERPDLQYSLGWYVQEFEGLQMLWHTGRWRPSTSALYVKLPQKRLTLIVLANTDNLTTPFDAVGCGDVSKSALTLSFFRHFVYPGQQGQPLPEVDWSQPIDELVNELSMVKEEAARRYLERELWALRQVYASVGREDQVQKLWHVSLRAFPQSQMRPDWMFSQTASRSAYVPPILSAAGLWRVTWYAIVWIACALLSLVWMLVMLLCSTGVSTGEWVVWLFATGLLGPLSLVTYKLVRVPPGRAPQKWQQALGTSVFFIAPHVVGWALALELIKRQTAQPNPLAILGMFYLAPLLIGLVVLWIPTWLAARQPTFGKWLARTLLSEIILFSVCFSVLFAGTMFVDHRILSTLPGLTSPLFWAMLSLLAGLGFVALTPITYWLAHCGQLSSAPGHDESPSFVQPVPTLKRAWPHLVVSLFTMITLLTITIRLIA